MDKRFILALCLFCVLIYFSALNNGFVLDDWLLIIGNPFVKSSAFLPDYFRQSLYSHIEVSMKPINEMYRPLQMLSLFFDYKISGFNPIGFHITNVLLHLMNAILVYLLFRLIFNDERLSKIASVLFLAHPIHASVVSYVSGRADSLACLFMLASIVLFSSFIKKRRILYYILSIAFAGLALLSRENAVFLFLFITLVLFITGARRKDYFYIAPFIALNIFYLLLRFALFGHNAVTMTSGFVPLFFRLINFLNIGLRYLSLFLFPADLHFFRTTPFITVVLTIETIRVVLTASLLALLVIKYRRQRPILLGVLWFLSGIAPVFVLMDSYPMLEEAMMAESWVYMASVGFFAAFGQSLCRLKRLGITLAVCFAVFYGFLTANNNFYWRNDVTLHKNMMANTTQRNYLRLNLITSYLKCGLHKEALKEIEKFKAQYPDTCAYYHAMGQYYSADGQLEKAIDNFKLALGKNKNFFFACYSISKNYKMLKKLEDALYWGLECFKIEPRYVPNLISLGDLYAEKRQFGEAKRYYESALKFQPDSQGLKEKIKNLMPQTALLSLRQNVKKTEDRVLVKKVIDGDTIVLAGGEKIRYIGINTPETYHPKKSVEYYGYEAAEFNKGLVLKKPVRFEFDVQRYDKYGRTLAYVYLEDDTFVNAELLRQGYARIMTIPPNTRYADLFRRLEKEARTKKLGIWQKMGYNK